MLHARKGKMQKIFWLGSAKEINLFEDPDIEVNYLLTYLLHGAESFLRS